MQSPYRTTQALRAMCMGFRVPENWVAVVMLMDGTTLRIIKSRFGAQDPLLNSVDLKQERAWAFRQYAQSMERVFDKKSDDKRAVVRLDQALNTLYECKYGTVLFYQAIHDMAMRSGAVEAAKQMRRDHRLNKQTKFAAESLIKKGGLVRRSLLLGYIGVPAMKMMDDLLTVPNGHPMLFDIDFEQDHGCN